MTPDTLWHAVGVLVAILGACLLYHGFSRLKRPRKPRPDEIDGEL